MGNETGHGDCFRHAMAQVRALDPARLIHWGPGNTSCGPGPTWANRFKPSEPTGWTMTIEPVE